MTSSNLPEGYDLAAVEAWIRDEIRQFTPPFRWTRLEGGHSNLTYLLEDEQGRKAVIRRPPLGELLPKAHDMNREWRLISGLGPTPVPVPEALGYCEDQSVTGASFYVMGHVEGRPLYTAEDTLVWVPEDRRTLLARSFIDVLAELHSLDPDEIGLGDLGKKEDYVGRQLRTWYRSWNASIKGAQLDDPRAHDLQRYFLDRMPEQGRARVVHGDYGLHNVLVGADSRLSAVLDWEISTLGDPLADLAYALNAWLAPGEDPTGTGATTVPGFPPRSALAEHYAEQTGRDLGRLDYYVGFNRWKSACIVHGVYARYMEGKKDTEGVDLERLRERIGETLEKSVQAVERLEAGTQV